MPPPKTKSVALPRRRRPVKRSKTFSGCWTCRARGVKCDERKPRCARCDKARVACAGYGIRLVWEDDKERGLVPENGRSLRRVLLADPDAAPVLSNDELDVALAALDEGLAVRACGVDGVQRGPFTVFPTFPTTGRWRERFLPTAAAPCPQLAHCPGVPDEERRLMHHYVTYLSDLMLATRLGSSNPFQTVFIPLAMLEAGQQTPTPSHTALWHALCALAAYNLVRLDAREGQRHASVAIEHHALAFQSLRHCIGDRDPKIQHVVMATILLITIIEIMLNKPGWRVHLRGGRAWLRSLPDLRGVGRDSAVYQLFLLIETFASLQDQGSIGYRGSKTAKGRPDAEDADDSSQELTDLSDLDEYHLDSLYGIPKQLFQVVVEMNHVVRKDSPTRDELDRLELKILKNSPKARRGFPDTPHQQKLSHYAAAFYYASYIYFKCTLRNLPIADVQYLVRESARHIEAIDHLEDGKIPSLVWPGLITASAAGEEQTRQAMLRYFKRRENHRLRNLSTQVTLICEVWRRRDAGEAAKTVKEVMKEMGRDILLL